MTILELSYTSTFVWPTYIFLFVKTSLKYSKNTKANVQNNSVMTNDFNIKDSNWDSLYLFHLIHSKLLIDITNAFDLSLSCSTNFVFT